MSVSGKIKTTGELREFLAMMMVGVKNGDLDIDKASRITKLAGQINESFYAEVKIGQVRMAAGAEVARLGALTINQDDGNKTD